MKLVTINAKLTATQVAKARENAKTEEQKEIAAALPDSGCEGSIEYPFGETLEEDVELYSIEVVKGNFEKEAFVQLQSNIRGKLLQGISPKKLQGEFYDRKTNAFIKKLGAGPKRMDAAEKEANRLRGLDPEARKREIEKLREQLKAIENEN